MLFYCSLDFLNYNRTGIHFISWKNSCKTCNTAELDSEGTHAPITATFLPTRRGSLFLPFGCGGSLWAPSDGTPRDQALVRPPSLECTSREENAAEAKAGPALPCSPLSRGARAMLGGSPVPRPK